MANTAQARKRARQAEVHRQRNTSERSAVRSAIKKVVNTLESGDKAQAQAAYTAATPVIDSMARKGIISKNKAARHKSRLNAHLKAMQG
ncbi:MAG: 30S ribosomal protein S20 [Gammaproteobacteria bacterium]|nr:30S ribosomal protein S20 [Gammaproteobacteria bacterium]